MAYSNQSSSPQVLTPAPPGKDKRFTLTTIALTIIALSISAIMLSFYFKEFEATGSITKLLEHSEAAQKIGVNTGDTLSILKTESLKFLVEEKKDFRDFFLKLTQIILLNLLLPILTAILGYKAGSSASD